VLSKCDASVRTPQALCVVPTRELARQIYDEIKSMGQFTKIEIGLAVPESATGKGIVRDQIIVGTAGTVAELINKGMLKTKDIKVFVLDEADEMLGQQGMSDQSLRIQKALPPRVQHLLFSATFPDKVAQFAYKVVPKPLNEIRLKREEVAIGQVKHFVIDCRSEANKFPVLEEIYGNISVGQSIIFMQTRKSADELTKRMSDAGHAVSLLRGGPDISAEERDKVIDSFRKGSTKVLIATNIIARGIDIPQVSLVINYELPDDGRGKPDPETYLHRIGRCGRFGRNGLAINLLHDDETRRKMKFISSQIDKEMTELLPEKIENLEKMLKDLNAAPSGSSSTK